MKKIQSQLIKPFIQKMEAEWQDLYDKLCHSQIPEAEELRPLALNHLDQLQKMLRQASVAENLPLATTDSANQFIRQSKIDFRLAQRRWVRHLVSRERLKTRLANHPKKKSSEL